MTLRKKILLFVDLDRTLLGDPVGLQEFIRWHGERRDWLRIVYASGRFHDSMQDAIRHQALPQPDAWICGVGTEIRSVDGDATLADWRRQFTGDWSALRVHVALAQFNRLQLQPDEFQSEFKVSYYGHRLDPAQLDALRAALRACGVIAHVVYSSDRDLDVLPKAAGKGSAAAFLVRRWKWDSRNVIVSGDSGNDLSLFQQGFRGIVVGNAHASLRALAGPDVYVSPHSFAGGVLDGLRHWLGE